MVPSTEDRRAEESTLGPKKVQSLAEKLESKSPTPNASCVLRVGWRINREIATSPTSSIASVPWQLSARKRAAETSPAAELKK